MLINKANLDVLYTQVQKAFRAGMESKPALEKLMAIMTTLKPSTSAKNLYPWMDRTARYRLWEGDREWHVPSMRKFELENLLYELSEVLSREDVEDDQYGYLSDIAEDFGAGWPQLQYDKMFEVLLDNHTCFTGSTFFHDTGHTAPYYGTIVDNNVTTSLANTAVEAAFATAGQWKYKDGTLCRTKWTHLVVGEALRTTAWNIVENSKVAVATGGMIDNSNQGRLELIVDPALNATAGIAGDVDAEHYWFLLDCSGSLKPLVRQIRRVPAPRLNTDPAQLEELGLAKYFGSGRLAVGPTFPHLAYRAAATS